VASGNKGRDIQRFYDELDSRMKAFMVENTSMTSEFIEEIKDREYYIFADAAKELNIVDSIIGIDCDLDEIL
jgi:ATP-dependent protease ClpP protease subunit